MKKNLIIIITLSIIINLLTSCTDKPKSTGVVQVEEKIEYNSGKFMWASYKIEGKVYDKAGILIPVNFSDYNPERQLYFQFDLGSPISYLNHNVISKFEEIENLNKEQDTSIISLKIEPFKGNYIQEEFTKIYEDLDLKQDSIIGILGISSVKNQKLLIDFPEEEIYFLNNRQKLPKKFADNRRTKVNAKYKNDRFILTVNYNQKDSLRLLYDRGASEFPMILSNEKWKSLTDMKLNDNSLNCVEGPTVGGKVITCGTTIETEMYFGNISFSNFEVFFLKKYPYTLEDISASSGIAFDGLVGNKLFYNSNSLLFDFSTEDSDFIIFE